MTDSTKFPRVVSDLLTGIKNIDSFIDRSPALRDQVRKQADEQIAELETRVDEAFTLRSQYEAALEALGCPLTSELLATASEPTLELIPESGHDVPHNHQ